MPDTDAYSLYAEGRSLMDEGRFSEAVQVLERSCRVDPHFKTWELIGECRMALGEWQEAVAPLVEATHLNQGVRAPSLLAEVFLCLGDRRRAEEFANVALAREPNNRRGRRVSEEASETPPQPEDVGATPPPGSIRLSIHSTGSS